MNVRHVQKFPVGEYAEGMEWEIQYNGKLSRESFVPECPHVIVAGDSLTLPIAIVAYNEAGHNKTILCGACVLQGLGKQP